MRKVMAFGTFDCLHPGHLDYLMKAKALGKYLLVVVARNSGVRAIKQREPVNSEQDRLKLIQHIDFVDEAVLGDREMRKWGVIKKHNPAIIALGYDQWASIPSLRKELSGLHLEPKIVRIKAYGPEKNSSRNFSRKF